MIVGIHVQCGKSAWQKGEKAKTGNISGEKRKHAQYRHSDQWTREKNWNNGGRIGMVWHVCSERVE